MKFICPHCRHEYNHVGAKPGQKAKCKYCSQVFTISQPPIHIDPQPVKVAPKSFFARLWNPEPAAQSVKNPSSAIIPYDRRIQIQAIALGLTQQFSSLRTLQHIRVDANDAKEKGANNYAGIISCINLLSPRLEKLYNKTRSMKLIDDPEVNQAYSSILNAIEIEYRFVLSIQSVFRDLNSLSKRSEIKETSTLLIAATATAYKNLLDLYKKIDPQLLECFVEFRLSTDE